MKKTVIKLFVFFVVFLLTLVVVSGIMNRGHDNLTMEMASSTLPLVTMMTGEVEYNRLHGYYGKTDVACQRDSITVLGEGRNAGFVVDTYGQNVTGVFIEARSGDGSRLIERTEIKELRIEKDRIYGNFALKDLIERDTEYSLAIVLELEGDKTAFYYTRAIWSEDLYVEEKLDFVIDFHERLYNREAARELVQYLESNAQLEDNTSFHKVNIHSSFQQITWGSLDVTEVMRPVARLAEIANQTASLVLDYVVSTSEGKTSTYYMVEEYYRIRYTVNGRYLLDYERTMTQIPNEEELCAADKLLLGITGADVDMVESEDGNTVVFQVAGRLFSYDVTENKLTVIFSFYDEKNADARSIYAGHTIKILDVGEGGNVQFAVYGYMNRGRHEGEVGIQIYTHNSAQNTIEELLYIPYDKSSEMLEAEMRQLLFLSREQKLYLVISGTVYRIDLNEKTYTSLTEITEDEGLQVSADHKAAVWPEDAGIYDSRALNIWNFAVGSQKILRVPEGEVIRPLGFMEEDIIYGAAYVADIVEESSGRIFYPMYKICICNSAGELLKEYKQQDIYVTDCMIMDNQITLQRLKRSEEGEFQETVQEHITNNMETDSGRNVIVTADIEKYERYVEIQVRKTIDVKALKILTPKEVVYEGGRQLSIQTEAGNGQVGYYVYGPYGVYQMYHSPANAVNLAYTIAGVVIDGKGEVVWRRGNRVARNQIMAIKEAAASEERGSTAVCLDTMLAYEGISRNTQDLLDEGENVLRILEKNLEDFTILNLTGCSVDAVLYYVNQDIPVLALLEDGSAVLLVGFNETNVGIMDPRKGSIDRMNTDQCVEWLAQNGNQFITYYSGSGS